MNKSAEQRETHHLSEELNPATGAVIRARTVDTPAGPMYQSPTGRCAPLEATEAHPAAAAAAAAGGVSGLMHRRERAAQLAALEDDVYRAQRRMCVEAAVCGEASRAPVGTVGGVKVSHDTLDLLIGRAMVRVSDPLVTIPALTVGQWRDVGLAFVITCLEEVRKDPAALSVLLQK